MKRLYVLALAMTLVAACGGSDDESSPATAGGTVPETTAAAQEEPADTGADDAASGSSAETTTTLVVQALGDGNADTTFYGNPPGTGTVEIGDIRYEFDLNILCLSMFGAMGVAGRAADGSAVNVDADFPPPGWEDSAEDWDPPSISVDDEGRDVRWQAGGIAVETYPEGSSQINSFTADGRLAVGEATFVNMYTFGDDLQIETGRFEFNCPEG